MTIKPWAIGDPGSAFDRACVIGASTRRFSQRASTAPTPPKKQLIFSAILHRSKRRSVLVWVWLPVQIRPSGLRSTHKLQVSTPMAQKTAYRAVTWTV
jgi:hypothetical protein